MPIPDTLLVLMWLQLPSKLTRKWGDTFFQRMAESPRRSAHAKYASGRVTLQKIAEVARRKQLALEYPNREWNGLGNAPKGAEHDAG